MAHVDFSGHVTVKSKVKHCAGPQHTGHEAVKAMGMVDGKAVSGYFCLVCRVFATPPKEG